MLDGDGMLDGAAIGEPLGIGLRERVFLPSFIGTLGEPDGDGIGMADMAGAGELEASV